MAVWSRGTLGVVCGVAGAIVVGYCLYFDHRRRSHPDFRSKLKDKRRRAHKSKVSGGSVTWPNLKDQEAVQKFFLSEVQAGEELLAQGDIEAGVDHLSRAVAVCGQPQQLLQVLQQTLPPQVFQLLLHKLPSVGESILQAAGSGKDSAKVTEEDVE